MHLERPALSPYCTTLLQYSSAPVTYLDIPNVLGTVMAHACGHDHAGRLLGGH
jgi:hypothetical protein